eukprot:1140454-Pelagomonas_calceolata.AAC.4
MTQVTCLEPLALLTSLYLDCSSMFQVTNLGTLAELNYCLHSSLQPLDCIDIGGVTDLKPLAALPSLRYMGCVHAVAWRE